ncbi:hypothetical protein LPB67_04275 [Undibacterium sp. Jales W-56]|uniref:hypothetical protein n=1 Tax=Undibacterium sp. Jales W-56 TaxID=2897325 RepID=UPI0021D242F8|nr:hypothetical protein [Undibacterium sp. Jales W-56]MCU6432993.1 hypothetical protein [Undibacterium sp. Jales W-56]
MATIEIICAQEKNMGGLTLPTYVLEYTSKTIDSVLSQDAMEGNQVEVDVYERHDVSKKYVASGQRLKDGKDTFRVSVTTESGVCNDEWNYTILRESAGRSRKMRK